MSAVQSAASPDTTASETFNVLTLICKFLRVPGSGEGDGRNGQIDRCRPRIPRLIVDPEVPKELTRPCPRVMRPFPGPLEDWQTA